MNLFVMLITMNWAAAITLAPFGIYVKEKYLPKVNWRYSYLINHEKIHWKQQLEMLIIFFYVWYFIEWLIRIFISTSSAYRSISFEREAYDNEYDLNYLNKRKRFAWFKYIIKSK